MGPKKNFGPIDVLNVCKEPHVLFVCSFPMIRFDTLFLCIITTIELTCLIACMYTTSNMYDDYNML